MYIILDSNIFFNNWYLRSAEFERLVHHANSVAATLVVSQVVVDEVSAKFEEHASNFRADEKKLKDACARLTFAPFDWPEITAPDSYDFVQILRSRFQDVAVASYDHVGHQRLVDKAIRKEMPFQSNEKGYRDALMWLTLLAFIKGSNSDRYVVFINENKNDFFEKGGDRLRLHHHLQADWDTEKLDNELFLYNKLSDFNDVQMQPAGHDIDLVAFIEQHADTIETAVSLDIGDYLEGDGTRKFLTMLCLSGLVTQNSDWEVIEGIEDFTVVQCQHISPTLSYVGVRFNLRIVSVSLKVAADVYRAQKHEIDATFQTVTPDGDFVDMSMWVRCYFEASLLYDARNEDVREIALGLTDLRT
ncbi:PIN domain-containing protein [Paraburkholderia sp. GAS348]|uniref:PIN domain-containing protein n=1 Tax=Paraburkholderia sp. GAS348 TaxID=3035132 RepID=UPI003D1DCA44